MERLRLELDSRRRRIERRIRRAERKVEAAYYGSDTSESSGDEVDREKAAEDYARLALEKKRKLEGGWPCGGSAVAAVAAVLGSIGSHGGVAGHASAGCPG